MSGDYLTKLRQKPKHVKDNIAFGVASGFTALVAAFLVFAVHGPEVIEGVSTNQNDPQFFQTLTSQVKEQVAGARSSLESQKKTEESTSVTPVPASSGSGTPAPAVINSTSSVEASSTQSRTVLIATTSAAADDVR